MLVRLCNKKPFLLAASALGWAPGSDETAPVGGIYSPVRKSKRVYVIIFAKFENPHNFCGWFFVRQPQNFRRWPQLRLGKQGTLPLTFAKNGSAPKKFPILFGIFRRKRGTIVRRCRCRLGVGIYCGLGLRNPAQISFFN